MIKNPIGYSQYNNNSSGTVCIQFGILWRHLNKRIGYGSEELLSFPCSWYIMIPFQSLALLLIQKQSFQPHSYPMQQNRFELCSTREINGWK
jgi:hypothetical protein